MPGDIQIYYGTLPYTMAGMATHPKIFQLRIEANGLEVRERLLREGHSEISFDDREEIAFYAFERAADAFRDSATTENERRAKSSIPLIEIISDFSMPVRRFFERQGEYKTSSGIFTPDTSTILHLSTIVQAVGYASVTPRDPRVVGLQPK